MFILKVCEFTTVNTKKQKVKFWVVDPQRKRVAMKHNIFVKLNRFILR